MKLLTTLTERIGIDRCLHFSLSWALTSVALPFGWRWTLFAAVVVLMLSVIKEGIDDHEKGNKADWIDVFAGVVGSLVPLAYSVILSVV